MFLLVAGVPTIITMVETYNYKGITTPLKDLMRDPAFKDFYVNIFHRKCLVGQTKDYQGRLRLNLGVRSCDHRYSTLIRWH